MDAFLRVFGLGLGLSMIIGVTIFSMESCMAEDHRHGEEMRRMQLAQDQCDDFMRNMEAN